MATYYGVFANQDEEEKKKKTPSQVASEQVKKGKYYGVFEGVGTEISKLREEEQKKQPVVETKPQVVEPQKKTLGQKIVEGVNKVGSFIFGDKEVKKSEKGRPLSVQLSDDEYVSIVGEVQKYREEAVQQLNEAERVRNEYYKGKIRQVDPALDKRVDALKWAIEDYDEFLGNEPANRGVLKSIVKGFEKGGIAPDFWEGMIAEKQGEALNKYQKGEQLSTEEQGYVNSFRASMYKTLVEEQIGDMAGEVVAGIPKYAMLIWATLQGTKAPMTALKSGVMPKVPEGVLQKIVPKILDNSVSLAMASNLNVPGISAQTANYMLPTVDYEKAIGKDILTQLKPGDAPMEAQKKAYLSNLVEFVSEGAGAYLDDAFPFVKKLIIGKWLRNKNISPANPNIVKKILATAQFNSLAGEVFEEEIAEPVQAIIEGREYKDPLFTPEGRERLLVEVLGIGAFSGMAKVSDIVLNKIINRRKNNGDVAPPVENIKRRQMEFRMTIEVISKFL